MEALKAHRKARALIAALVTTLLSAVSPAVAAGAPSAITSADHATFFVGRASAFTVTAARGPRPALAETGALPPGIRFVDHGDGTATLSGTPRRAGAYPLTVTARSGGRGGVKQQFLLTIGQGWYNTSWQYRKQITINHTKVGASLSNYPVLISRTDSDLATGAQSTGNDILFTGSDGTTKLNHQIESYTSATGQLVAWVTVPSLSSSTDTVVYMYYGNASATNQQSAASVWDSNYTGVWHLSEAVSTTTGAYKDSTSNTNNATYQGSPGMTQTAGEIDGSLTLNGSSNYLSTTNQATVPSTDTVEAWFKTTTASGNKIVSYEQNQTGTASANYDRMLWVGTDGVLRFGVYTGAYSIASGSVVTDGVWHHAVGVDDNTAKTLTLYLDGAIQSAVAYGGTPQSYSGWWRIGSYAMYNGSPGWTGSASGYFPGSVDEVRVSTTARGSGWISTEYNNEGSPSTFVTVGSPQSLTAPSITSASVTTFTVGQAGTFTVTTTGTPTPTLSETGTLPTGVTFTDNGDGTATLAGTPTTTGNNRFTITAHNSASPDATQSFILTVAQTWYNTNWLYRKAITVDHTKVSAATTSFAVLISRTDSDLAAHAQSSGHDILFTDSDKLTKLNHQIESYNSATGQIVVWVQVPALSATTDTVFYMYYGNAAAADQQNVSGTWRSEYTGVWHLSESPTGTAPQFKDSTSNANNGTAQGSIPSGAQVAGKVDGSITLDGVANYISTAVQQSNPQAFSEECWVKTTTASGKAVINFEGPQTGTNNPNGYYDRSLYVGTDGKPHFVLWDGFSAHILSGTSTITDGNWHYLAGTYNGSTMTIFVDGAAIASTVSSSAQVFNGYWRIGSYDESGYSFAADGYFPGSVDEVRAANVAWANTIFPTRYNNQNSPSTFTSVAAEVAYSIPPAITSNNSATFTAGQAGTFTVSAIGTPTPSLSETGALPGGVSFVDNGNGTATLSGTPTTSGTYTLTVTAHNTASPDDTQTFTLTVAAGSLSITAPGSASLGSATLGSTVSGALGSVQVTDNRGNASASWTATVSSTTFTAGAATVPLANVRYWSGTTTSVTGTGTFTPGQTNSAAAQALTASRTSFTLASGAGTNTATWNPTLVVTIPITLVPGGYTGTVTHSVA